MTIFGLQFLLHVALGMKNQFEIIGYPGRAFQDICYYSANLYFSISNFHRMSPDKCGIK